MVEVIELFAECCCSSFLFSKGLRDSKLDTGSIERQISNSTKLIMLKEDWVTLEGNFVLNKRPWNYCTDLKESLNEQDEEEDEGNEAAEASPWLLKCPSFRSNRVKWWIYLSKRHAVPKTLTAATRRSTSSRNRRIALTGCIFSRFNFRVLLIDKSLASKLWSWSNM